MKHHVHLVGGNLTNRYGMEYYLFKALRDENALGNITSYRKEVGKRTSMRIRDLKSDILLVLKGELVDPTMVYSAPRYSVLWYQDDVLTQPHAARDIRNLAWAFDKVYSFDKCALENYRSLGARDVGWLPLAADPQTHRWIDAPKEWNISFVGHMFPNRMRLYEKLMCRSYLQFGRDRFDGVLFTTDYMKYAEIVAKSKINLNLGIGPTGIQQRVFEILAMKGFLLTNLIGESGRIFKDKEHLVYFTEDNICDLLDYYLTHDKEREEIAASGHNEVLEKHTHRCRIRKIIEDYERRIS